MPLTAPSKEAFFWLNLVVNSGLNVDIWVHSELFVFWFMSVRLLHLYIMTAVMCIQGGLDIFRFSTNAKNFALERLICYLWGGAVNGTLQRGLFLASGR